MERATSSASRSTTPTTSRPASSRHWDRYAQPRCPMSVWSHRVTEMKRDLRIRRKRGQSLAEMAVVIPVLIFLLMGGFDATVMIADKVTAGYAVRQGARLAAPARGGSTRPHR